MSCIGDDLAKCCGLCEYTPVVLMCTHERKEITMTNIRMLKKQKCKVAVVVSSIGEQILYSGFADYVFKYPNKPLGNKWQHGVDMVRMIANPLIIVGSDDIVSADFIEQSRRWMKDGFDFVGFSSWYIYDDTLKESYRATYQKRNENLTIGAGRVYSKRFIEQVEGKLFNTIMDKKLDDFGFIQVQKHAQKIKIIKDTPMIMSVKGNWKQMNPIDKILKSPNIEAVKISNDILKQFLCVE